MTEEELAILENALDHLVDYAEMLRDENLPASSVVCDACGLEDLIDTYYTNNAHEEIEKYGTVKWDEVKKNFGL